MKKFASLLLTVLMLATMFCVFAVPASAEAAEKSPLCLTSTGNTKIGFATIPDSPYKLEYAVNGGEWTQANENTEINLNDKDSVCFRANGSSETLNVFVHLSFKMSGTGTVAASGNAMSLLKDDKCCAYCFSNLFYNCTVLTAAPTLPATTLAPGCYGSMFKGCTALKVAPALPATTLAVNCYSSMFSGCTALTAAPTLLATEMPDLCYDTMFENCTSLKITAEKPKTGHYSELRFPNMECLHLDQYFNYTFYGVPDMPAFKSDTTYYSPHSSGSATEYEDEIETVHFQKEVCADCGAVLSRTEMGRDVTVTKTIEPHNTNSETNPAVGSVLSEGNLVIVCTVASAVVFGFGGFLTAMFIFKKKKPALAGGTDKNE